MALYLTSLRFDGLAAWLTAHGGEQTAGASGRPRVAVVTNASLELPDQSAIVAPAVAALEGDFEPVVVDVTADIRALETADAIVMTGGDPFRLLADLRRSGADQVLRARHSEGLPIAGQSAGAMVCAPDLTPLEITSPFPVPGAFDFRGLGLTRRLVLPHHDRPGRAGRHRQAALANDRPLPLTILWDDEILIEDDTGAWQILRTSQRTRAATASDADAVATLFGRATRQAWSSFVGEDRLAAHAPPAATWTERIRAAGDRFLVTEADGGLAGFCYHRPENDDPAAGAGEVDLLYTDPDVWGLGVGRRLLQRATWDLLCAGYREAVLYTEARNRRALHVYRRGGWVLDGGEQRRDYFGAPIRNLRHRLDLTTFAGGDTAPN